VRFRHKKTKEGGGGALLRHSSFWFYVLIKTYIAINNQKVIKKVAK
jgi:hypothetical protein